MVQDEPRADGAAAQRAPQASRGGGGRGFLAGLVGGVLGAGGSIYALQIPEVRDSLPLPQQAELIVNPAAVARIGALEAELAQVRDAAREAEETSSIEALDARVDGLSGELTRAATTAQLAALRDGLSELASPDGAAELGARLDELSVAVDELDETAARASALATVQAAVEGFEARVSGLEANVAGLDETVAGLEAKAADLGEGTDELAGRVAEVEAALVERAAALTGRVDGVARDVAGLRESLGGAGTRLDQVSGRVGELATTAEANGTQLADLGDRLTASETAMTAFEAAMTEDFTALSSQLADRTQALGATVEQAQDAAGNAVTVAERTEATVAMALARTRAAVALNAAAGAVGEALQTGAGLQLALTTLDGVTTAPVTDDEADRLAAARSTLEEHEGGVPTLPVLKSSLDDLTPAMLAAVQPPQPAAEQGGIHRRVFGALGVTPLGRAPELDDAVVAIEAALARGDPAAAIAAAETVPSEAADVIAPWIANAQRHLAVDKARDALLSLGRDLAAASAS